MASPLLPGDRGEDGLAREEANPALLFGDFAAYRELSGNRAPIAAM